jgi:hypothetical protein
VAHTITFRLVASLLLALSCTPLSARVLGGSPPGESLPSGHPGARVSGTPAAAAPPPARPASTATDPGAGPVVGATPNGTPLFPPKDVRPPFERSAAPGDGRFEAFGEAARGERAATEPPLVVRTVIHPHPESRWMTVTVAAIDLDRVAVRLMPGTEDLRYANLPVGSESGLVPEADRPALIAVMNGGFQPKHGHWGLVANGVVVSKPREDGCTIALDPGFGVQIGPFAGLPEAARASHTLRQTPPCLVEGGLVHPALVAGKDKAWAGHTADLRTRRRSALGIDASRRVLFYAIGEETEPRWLAEGLRVAGATSAAELDINWYWTRFLLFGNGTKDGPDARSGLRITSTLVPKMEHQETEYVERASTRDFFYVVRRDLLPPTTP